MVGPSRPFGQSSLTRGRGLGPKCNHRSNYRVTKCIRCPNKTTWEGRQITVWVPWLDAGGKRSTGTLQTERKSVVHKVRQWNSQNRNGDYRGKQTKQTDNPSLQGFRVIQGWNRADDKSSLVSAMYPDRRKSAPKEKNCLWIECWCFIWISLKNTCTLCIKNKFHTEL